MNGLAWQAEYCSGVEVIDQEHQQLLQLLQQLYEAIAQGKAFTHVEPLLLGCAAETQRHFQHEETLMADANHPQYLSHRAAHQNLLRDLNRLLDAVQSQPSTLSTTTVATIGQLVIQHICEEDLPMLYLLTHPEELARQQAEQLTAETCF
ncbi:bacteriohemerythrin [Thermosynechococcus sp. M55_K2018_012]|uniref:bacteriohemerythrin n=1 Tax=Thermosynechococcus sp. M55_K2018_012 TaxID=2747809 RepID=UPI0019DD966D|nr:bacteriohemerythrin [Thermosynechococcus sp. M55_K2018_012]HIK48921.1 bacteriohemerythrin [Thermosynechococcus sp. M55_K2018_012]